MVGRMHDKQLDTLDTPFLQECLKVHGRAISHDYIRDHIKAIRLCGDQSPGLVGHLRIQFHAQAVSSQPPTLD